MDKAGELSDLYKLPPMDVKSIDQWKGENDNNEDDAESDGVDIPDPDYDPDDDDDSRRNGMVDKCLLPAEDSQGMLIEPKKLANPCLDSREHKDLHREIMMNKKRGVDVLHMKSELTQEMQRRRTQIKKKEEAEKHMERRTSFEIKLGEQANKLKLEDEKKEKTEKQKYKPKPIEEEENIPEFLRVHSKIQKSKSNS